jgi:hypothetical protein
MNQILEVMLIETAGSLPLWQSKPLVLPRIHTRPCWDPLNISDSGIPRPPLPGGLSELREKLLAGAMSEA